MLNYNNSNFTLQNLSVLHLNQMIQTIKVLCLVANWHVDLKLFQVEKEINHVVQKKKNQSENEGTIEFSWDKNWPIYLNELKQLGLLQGKEGSPEWQQRISFHRETYMTNYIKPNVDHFRVYQSLLYPGETIDQLLRNYKEDQTLINTNQIEEDDDSWLEITPDQLDNILAQKHKEMNEYLQEMKNKKNPSKEKNEKTSKPQPMETSLDGMIGEMKQFLGMMSGYEGAELPHQSDEEDNEGQVLPQFQKDECFSDEDYNIGEESPSEDEKDEDIQRIMEELDDELLGTAMAESFERKPNQKVDVDLNLTKTMLQSFGEQHGLAGPFSNIYGAIRDEKRKSGKQQQTKGNVTIEEIE